MKIIRQAYDQKPGKLRECSEVGNVAHEQEHDDGRGDETQHGHGHVSVANGRPVRVVHAEVLENERCRYETTQKKKLSFVYFNNKCQVNRKSSILEILFFIYRNRRSQDHEFEYFFVKSNLRRHFSISISYFD